MNITQLSLLVGLTLWGAHAYGGNESSGGGDGVFLKDDRVILADAFIRRVGKPAALHPALIEELKRVDAILVGLGEDHKFVEENVLSPFVEYRFTADALDCARIVVGQLPQETHSELIACTKGPLTVISETAFKKMSIREQAKLIVHERLRALKVGAPDDYIADLTDGLEVALNLLNEEKNGARPRLNSAQIEAMKTILMRLAQLEMASELRSSFNQWMITAQGGGRVHLTAKLAQSSFAGVSSVVGMNSELGSGVQVSESKIDAYCKLEEGVVLFQSLLSFRGFDEKCLILQNAVISRSQIVASKIKLGESALVQESSLRSADGSMMIDGKIKKSTATGSLDLAASAVLEESQVSSLTLEDNARVIHSQAYGMSLGKNALIANSYVGGGSMGYAARIFDSKVGGVTMKAESTISESNLPNIGVILDVQASVTKADVTGAWKLRMGKQSSLKDSQLDLKSESGKYNTLISLGDHVRLENIQLKVNSNVLSMEDSSAISNLSGTLFSKSIEGNWGALTAKTVVAILSLPLGIIGGKDGFLVGMNALDETFFTSAVFVEENAQIDGKNEPLCRGSQIAEKNGPMKIKSLEKLQGLCR